MVCHPYMVAGYVRCAPVKELDGTGEQREEEVWNLRLVVQCVQHGQVLAVGGTAYGPAGVCQNHESVVC